MVKIKDFVKLCILHNHHNLYTDMDSAIHFTLTDIFYRKFAQKYNANYVLFVS